MDTLDYTATGMTNPFMANQGQINPRAAECSAAGKAIIVGEHAVVYGAQAIAIPLKNMRATMKLTPRIRINASTNPTLTFAGKPVSSHVQKVVADALSVFGIDSFAADLDGRSAVPIGAGLGSSASLCVVLLKTIAKSLDIGLSKTELASMGNKLEARFHGNPSGLDTAVVAHELPITFCKSMEPTPIKIASTDNWKFAIIDSGIRSSTISMINVAAPYFRGEHSDHRIATFETIAEHVETGFSTGDLSLVGDAMNECGAYLKEAGVVSSNLESIIDAANEIGVLGAKSTGAGGGGAVMTLLNPACYQQQLRELRNKLPDLCVHPISLD